MTWLQELPHNYIHCRSLRHAWSAMDFRAATEEDVGRKRIPHEFDQVVKREVSCERCSTRRVELFGRSREALRDFERFSVQYQYPGKYLWDSTQVQGDRPNYRDVNREMFRRMPPSWRNE